MASIMFVTVVEPIILDGLTISNDSIILTRASGDGDAVDSEGCQPTDSQHCLTDVGYLHAG